MSRECSYGVELASFMLKPTASLGVPMGNALKSDIRLLGLFIKSGAQLQVS
jgi:hypothetical protein